jgi:hypothetical protein
MHALWVWQCLIDGTPQSINAFFSFIESNNDDDDDDDTRQFPLVAYESMECLGGNG